MEEYRIDMKVRNNLILTKIEEQGYSSALSFCNATGVSYERLMKFLNMKESIFDSKGIIKRSVMKLCEELYSSPEELFSANQMEANLKTNKVTLKVNEAEAIFLMNQNDNQKLLEDHYSHGQMVNTVDKCLDTLTPRERKVIEMRMGLGEYTCEHTLEQIGNEFGVSRTRIRDIESKALRKMRHPSRADELRPYLESCNE